MINTPPFIADNEDYDYYGSGNGFGSGHGYGYESFNLPRDHNHNVKKPEIHNRVRLIKTFDNPEHIPAGTNAYIIEQLGPNAYLLEVAIPDPTLVGMHRYTTLFATSNNFESCIKQ